MSEKVHFIAIGGSAMHNLALALAQKGHQVTGSDDEIFEPSRTRLANANLLPAEMGWFADKIDKSYDAIIVGMHARKDNPEIVKARELEIPVYSYPEYIYAQSIDKQRVVIGGSHGKTTITAMIMHVLKYNNRKFDFMVGAQVEGFDVMVKLSDDAAMIILEGDEYPASPLAPKPKFLYYKHHIALISGIAWDHINAYPTENDYVRQFDKLADATPKGGALVFNDDDHLAHIICQREREDVLQVPYSTHPHKIINGKTFLETSKGQVYIEVFGEHNLKNLAGAKSVCMRLNVTEMEFYNAISSFKGAANRLELLAQNAQTNVYKDFAHAPSKLKATTRAVKKQFPERKLVACMELHTFSSLNKEFLRQYKDSFAAADVAVVYFNPQTVAHKNLESISFEDIKKGFNDTNLVIFDDSEKLKEYLLAQSWANKNLLLMSSGNYNNINTKDLSMKIIG